MICYKFGGSLHSVIHDSSQEELPTIPTKKESKNGRGKRLKKNSKTKKREVIVRCTDCKDFLSDVLGLEKDDGGNK
jgi:hypothetical protein